MSLSEIKFYQQLRNLLKKVVDRLYTEFIKKRKKLWYTSIMLIKINIEIKCLLKIKDFKFELCLVVI